MASDTPCLALRDHEHNIRPSHLNAIYNNENRKRYNAQLLFCTSDDKGLICVFADADKKQPEI